ncbi:tyrosine-protein kinase family protein [Marichromatium bheemlicum]|uniref:CpsD/CapB family tyrosine-protein kinase n=1 Tax=Marichromatium bheemlicum TaxID=365339 RepID=A0ABX1I8K4_9GAMM|nr:CpsD/CapB family tyrosine-protein kinase [Marichromatium bheemlicum]NKN33892.1 CpsD/CapB family tyrosine-protein kinase [Marichromatium bheemlicum]
MTADPKTQDASTPSIPEAPGSAVDEDSAATPTEPLQAQPSAAEATPEATPDEATVPTTPQHVMPGRLHLDTRRLPQPEDDSRPWFLFIAIDQATRWVFVRVTHEISPAATRAFLKTLLKTSPILIRELVAATPSEQDEPSEAAALPGPEALARLCANLDIDHHVDTAEPPQTTVLMHAFDALLEAHLGDESAGDAHAAQTLKQALRQVARDYNHRQPQPILGEHTPTQALSKWHREHPECFVARRRRPDTSTQQTTARRVEPTPPTRSPAAEDNAARSAGATAPEPLTPLQLARTLNRNAVASSLIRLRQQPPLDSLLVSSCNDGAGKTTVALQLAYAGVHDIGLRILLIDANPTNPQLARLFDTDEGPGLCEFFAGQAEPDEVIRPTQTPGLDLVTLGLHQRDMLVRQDPQRLRARLDALRNASTERYDLLLVDGPSSLGDQDLAIGATAFDGVVLVIESERTRWEVMQYAQDRLQSAGARLLGAVLNKRKYYIPRGLYA